MFTRPVSIQTSDLKISEIEKSFSDVEKLV